jgi:GTP cyclohydrolase I
VSHFRNKESMQSVFSGLIRCVDPNAEREGLIETPARMAKAWLDHTTGYLQEPGEVLKAFEDGAEKYDEMVVVGGIRFYSRCEHHGEAIFGEAIIGYIPAGKVVGLSKLVRLTDVFAKRLQVQERMTQQIANALSEHLQPKGVGVMVRARHLCMEARGVCRHGAITTTTSLIGAVREGQPREEFLAQARQHNGPL